MITAITAILGFLSSVSPMAIRYFEKAKAFEHEAELIKLRMEAAQQGMDFQLVLESSRAAIEESKSLRDHDLALDGGRFLNILRASVRPIITYVFFLTFIGIKVTAAIVMYNNDVPIIDALPIIWDDATSAIFGAVCGFWFGYRTMMHVDKNRKL